MGYVIADLLAIVLFAGFVALTQYETGRGVRFAEPFRASIDRFAGRIEFLITHVDLAAFIRDTVRSAYERALHDAAHLALQATRFVERQLTRTVRYFRARFAERRAAAKPQTPPRESSSYVRAISDFKQELRKGDRPGEDASPS